MPPTKKNDENPDAATAADPTDVAEAANEKKRTLISAPTNGSTSAPSTYEMLDDYATDTLTAVKAWIEDHPALAMTAAAGLGFVAGRLISGVFPEPEPPSFAERVEERARKLRGQAAHYADDAGDVLSQKLRAAADALGDAAETAAHKAEAGYERSKDIADVVAEAAKAAVAGAVAKKADSWLSRRK